MPDFNDIYGNAADLESDRGLVLICHALLDDAITTLLQAQFQKTDMTARSVKVLLGPGTRPVFESFYVKAITARGFGLIPENIWNVLEKLNKPRNRAGHSSERFELTATEVEDVAAGLEGTMASCVRQRAQLYLEQSGLGEADPTLGQPMADLHVIMRSRRPSPQRLLLRETVIVVNASIRSCATQLGYATTSTLRQPVNDGPVA